MTSELEARKPSLPELLSLMDALDQELIEMPLEELAVFGAEINESVKQKVDGTHRYLRMLESRCKELGELITQLTKLKSVLSNKLNNCEEFLASQMLLHNAERLPGNNFTMTLKKSPAVDAPENFQFSPAYIEKHRQFIRVKTEWNKDALKRAFKEKSGEIPPEVSLKDNLSLSFTPTRKDLKK